MRVRKGDIVGGLSGSISRYQYVREIPGNDEWFAVCNKPEYPKKELAKMAQRPAVLMFTAVTKQASAILKDEVQKAEWKKRHLEAKREASRHQRHADAKGNPAVPVRLYDFIRRELAKTYKEGSVILR